MINYWRLDRFRVNRYVVDENELVCTFLPRFPEKLPFMTQERYQELKAMENPTDVMKKMNQWGKEYLDEHKIDPKDYEYKGHKFTLNHLKHIYNVNMAKRNPLLLGTDRANGIVYIGNNTIDLTPKQIKERFWKPLSTFLRQTDNLRRLEAGDKVIAIENIMTLLVSCQNFSDGNKQATRIFMEELAREAGINISMPVTFSSHMKCRQCERIEKALQILSRTPSSEKEALEDFKSFTKSRTYLTNFNIENIVTNYESIPGAAPKNAFKASLVAKIERLAELEKIFASTTPNTKNGDDLTAVETEYLELNNQLQKSGLTATNISALLRHQNYWNNIKGKSAEQVEKFDREHGGVEKVYKMVAESRRILEVVDKKHKMQTKYIRQQEIDVKSTEEKMVKWVRAYNKFMYISKTYVDKFPKKITILQNKMKAYEDSIHREVEGSTRGSVRKALLNFYDASHTEIEQNLKFKSVHSTPQRLKNRIETFKDILTNEKRELKNAMICSICGMGGMPKAMETLNEMQNMQAKWSANLENIAHSSCQAIESMKPQQASNSPSPIINAIQQQNAAPAPSQTPAPAQVSAPVQEYRSNWE